jgi:DNA-binding LytR/AlgR family response regulator
MNVLLIEDEKPAAARLKQLIDDILPNAQIFGPLESIAVTVEWLKTNPQPDLMFCDIQLADGYSFEIFDQVQVSSPIIFTTAYDQFAIRAFKHNSLDYLLKPIDAMAVEQAIRKFRSQQIPAERDLSWFKSLLANRSDYKSRFLVKFGEKIQAVETEEVAFFFSAEKVTFLQTHNGKRFVLDYTLDQLDRLLDPHKFFRINRKYLSSFSAIKEIHTFSGSRLKLRLHQCEDNDIFISRDKTTAFKEWLDG